MTVEENSRGVNCEICNKRINVDEQMMMFSPTRMGENKYMHHCCFQEHFLFEVWNALSLGIKYESHCNHVDYASGFNPATFTPDDVVKAVEKSLGQRTGHPFTGRLDRDCEICGLPDRDPIHKGQKASLNRRGEK